MTFIRPSRRSMWGCIAVLVIGTALALAIVRPFFAKAPVQNIQTWPLPETMSPQARAAASEAANSPLSALMPPLSILRPIMERLHSSAGAKMEKRFEVRVETSQIAGVPVRIIYPKGINGLGNGPILLNLHGGGFAVDSGSLTETIPIAAQTGMPVVAVLYRLSPEHPYPAALDDAHAVFRALAKDHKADGIAVFGTSAGAALSAQLLARLANKGEAMPAALGFFSGSADLSKKGDSESWMPTPNDEYLPKYIGAASPTDPVLSPLLGDISRFPSTLAISSTRDFLLSPTAIFARALEDKGVDVRLVVFDGLPHAFWSYMDIPETDQATALMARFLKSKLKER